MKKQVTRLLLIIMLAVLFVPLFSNEAKAEVYNSDGYINNVSIPLEDGINRIMYIDIDDTPTEDFSLPLTIRIRSGGSFYTLWSESDVYGEGVQLIGETRQSYIKIEIINNNIYVNDILKFELEIYARELIIGDSNGWKHFYNIRITSYDTQPPEINSRPILDLPFYIMYSDSEYNFINLQSYENLPVFTFGAYSDLDNMEFDVNWYGYGKMKRYIFQDGEWYLSETKLEGQNWNDIGADRKVILECNHSILDYTGETSLEPINYSSGQPPKIMGGSFDQQGYGVKFISPRNGFKDNSFLWRYQTWFRLPYDDIDGDKYIKDSVELGFGGDYKEGTKQVDFSNMEVKTIDGRKVIEGFYTISVGHDVGVNEVIFQAKRSNDDKYWSATLQTERLAGFVDEDGDGLDDRTGREDNNEENPWHYDDYNPDGNRPDRGQYGEDIIGTVSYYFDTLLYWLLSPFRLIAEGLQSTIAIVTDTFGWAGNFANMIGGLFSFLPGEITGMITLAFTSLIVFTIIKAVRK